MTDEAVCELQSMADELYRRVSKLEEAVRALDRRMDGFAGTPPQKPADEQD